jgi:hypothetical protein
MDRSKHKLEGEPSIFVRFRSGFRLFIQNNIREEIGSLLPSLKENDHKEVFKKEIKDIGDGSGAGIHPDSTWCSLVKEIFHAYERDRDVISDIEKNALIEILEIIIKSEPVTDHWDGIRAEILKRADVLSLWDRYSTRRASSLFGEVQRDKDGTYYTEEDGGRIEIIGTTKTQEEEHFDFIANDALSKYGRLGHLLSLIALLDIGEQFKGNPEHFSERMICSMPDDSWPSAYLHWTWYVWGAYDFVSSTQFTRQGCVKTSIFTIS